jgi:hypothetical protein
MRQLHERFSFAKGESPVAGSLSTEAAASGKK